MKLLMFSVYDNAVGAYMSPFFARAVGEAVRMFMDLSNDSSSNVGRHPADFSLMELGEFNDGDGSLVPLAHTRRVITGLECVNSVLAAEAESPVNFPKRMSS